MFKRLWNKPRSNKQDKRIQSIAMSYYISRMRETKDMICVEDESVISSSSAWKRDQKGQSICFLMSRQMVYKMLTEDTGAPWRDSWPRHHSNPHPNWVLVFLIPVTFILHPGRLTCFNQTKALNHFGLCQAAST